MHLQDEQQYIAVYIQQQQHLQFLHFCKIQFIKEGGIKMFLGIETKKDLKEQLEEAETRAVTHFTKVNKIENILKHSDETKENYFITLNKIKKVIFSNGNQKKDN